MLLTIGLVFVGLIITGAIVFEVLEGYQITTTEFYGIRSIGFVTYSLSLLFAYGHHLAAIYVIIVIPISWLLRIRVHSTMIRIAAGEWAGFGCSISTVLRIFRRRIWSKSTDIHMDLCCNRIAVRHS